MGGMIDKVVRIQKSAVDPSESAPKQKEPESGGVIGRVRRQSGADTDLPDDGLLLTASKKRVRGGSGPIGRARRALGYGDNVN